MTYTPPPIDQPITVLHEDKWLLAVSKPSGLLSVPGRGEDKQDCLESRIRAQYPGALTVHRLDMETSGLVLFARTKAAQAALGKLFETRQIDKTYIARVHGHLQGEGGTVNAAMRCDWTNRPRQMIDPNQGKEAITHWRVLAREAEATRVELNRRPAGRISCACICCILAIRLSGIRSILTLAQIYACSSTRRA